MAQRRHVEEWGLAMLPVRYEDGHEGLRQFDPAGCKVGSV